MKKKIAVLLLAASLFSVPCFAAPSMKAVSKGANNERTQDIAQNEEIEEVANEEGQASANNSAPQSENAPASTNSAPKEKSPPQASNATSSTNNTASANDKKFSAPTLPNSKPLAKDMKSSDRDSEATPTAEPVKSEAKPAITAPKESAPKAELPKTSAPSAQKSEKEKARELKKQKELERKKQKELEKQKKKEEKERKEREKREQKSKGKYTKPKVGEPLDISLAYVPESEPFLPKAKVASLIKAAKKHIGRPYKFGGTTPAGFDCSGYLLYVFKELGYNLPRTADEQYKVGKRTRKKSELTPGDLVFFTTYESGVSHCGIYLGNDEFIHASSSKGIRIDSLSNVYWQPRYYGGKNIVK